MPSRFQRLPGRYAFATARHCPLMGKRLGIIDADVPAVLFYNAFRAGCLRIIACRMP